ncbi:MAG: DegT/DnrJ/EryC1/StrS family aminotransferase [Candidatus Micrarchaeia archaeon]
MDKEMADAAAYSLLNEKLIMGESVFKFEEEFARYCGTSHAISVSSGTNALFFTFLALGIRGKSIGTTASSFIASANSIVQAGGKPAFYDINGDYTLEPENLPKDGSLSGLLPVHLYGHPCRMDEIAEYAQKRGIPVVEDACQAHGAVYRGKRCGSIGTAGCFSFYSTKNLTVGGDGGMITTNDDKLASEIEKLRNCGRKTFYEHDVIGYTSRLNTANAAIGRIQLKRLDAWNGKRRSLAAQYFRSLEGLGIGLPPKETADVKPAFHLFSIKHKERGALQAYLKGRGIETGTNYPVSLPLQPVYREMLGHKEGDFPKSEELSAQVLCLPMHVNLTEADVKEVCDAIAEFRAGGTGRAAGVHV